MTPNYQRLRKLLLIAMSSDQDGEVAGAMRAVKRVLARSGRDAHWLVAELAKEPPKGSWHTAPNYDWDAALDYCGEDLSLFMLSPRELEFILSLNKQRGHKKKNWKPSQRQMNWLGGIYQRVKITRRD